MGFFEQTFRFMDIGGHEEGLGFPEDQYDNLRELRIALMREEAEEYFLGEETNDPVQVADGLVDVIVIAFGSLVQYFGFDYAMQMLDEVARSNLSKFVEENGQLKPILREDGKILKGPNYSPPDIAGLVQKALS